jgi:serine/threonine-protein kinase
VQESTFESCDVQNTVSEQDPAAGTEVDEGSTVEIFVSLGLSISIPDVRGQPEGEATRILSKERLQVNSRGVFSDTVAAGRAVGTVPPRGSEVDCEDPVRLLVSKGAKLVLVPDVLGLQETEASNQLRDAGLVPNVETENSDEPEGTVIAVDPGPGSRIEEGSEVAITVSTGAGSIVVPDVEGQPEDTAIGTLQSRGVTNIKVIEQETTDANEDGRVTDQAPTGGTRIRLGDRVTIFVAVFVEEEEPPPDEDEEPPIGEISPRPPGGRP